jgi:hypothetical protein
VGRAGRFRPLPGSLPTRSQRRGSRNPPTPLSELSYKSQEPFADGFLQSMGSYA